MRRMVSRATAWMSTYVVVEISPETTTRPVFTSVSHATRPYGSCASTASSTPSEIWSDTLSGWPSVTDSDVNRYSLSANPAMRGSPLEVVREPAVDSSSGHPEHRLEDLAPRRRRHRLVDLVEGEELHEPVERGAALPA